MQDGGIFCDLPKWEAYILCNLGHFHLKEFVIIHPQAFYALRPTS